MTAIPFTLVNTFTEGPFTGGQTAVCIIEEKDLARELKEDALAQRIARETAVACTCFVMPEDRGYYVRWFGAEAPGELSNMKYTLPGVAEVLRLKGAVGNEAILYTVNGSFSVLKEGGESVMPLSAIKTEPYPIREEFVEALGVEPIAVFKGRDPIFILAGETDIRNVKPDFEKLKHLPEGKGAFIAADGNDADVVSRAFWPKIHIPEDTVCITMHTCLGPLWKERTGKNGILSRQASARGGLLHIECEGDTVYLSGRTDIAGKGELYF